jgi:hypothetical protein
MNVNERIMGISVLDAQTANDKKNKMVLSGDVRLVVCTKHAPRSRASTCPKYSCNVIAHIHK